MTAAVTHRSEERATAEVLRAPAPRWADALERLLAHKGDPWNWQNSELLRRECGVEARFFLLHRDGVPYSHLCVIETAGVGLLSHVWTEPADRGRGASAHLLRLALEDFRGRGGRALYLGAEPGGMAWHYYRRHGFEPVEPGSGCMARFLAPPDAFAESWFAGAGAAPAPLDWCDWPASAPLFTGDFPGRVRLAATQLIGRMLPEGPVLPILREQRRRRAEALPACAWVLRAESGAVLGWASRQRDPLWPDWGLVDLFCHPAHWAAADALLEALGPLLAPPLVAYADAGEPMKRAVLERHGFHAVTTLADWLKAPPAGPMTDVVVHAKR